MKFIHLTDCHLVPGPRALFALNPRERLRLAVADINANHADADFLVLTGDLADAGEPGAYAELSEILGELKMPCYLVLGNHDDREAFYAAFPQAPRAENGFMQYVEETEAGVFVILDTLEPGTSVGRLCEARLAWLDQQFETYADRDIFLCLHHAPFKVGIPSMDEIGLMDDHLLAERVKAHGRVRHVFFGHLHRPLSGNWQGVSFSTLPGTNHQVALSLTDPVRIPGNHGRPAYAVVLVQEGNVLIHQHDYLETGMWFDLDDKIAEFASSLDEMTPFERVDAAE